MRRSWAFAPWPFWRIVFATSFAQRPSVAMLLCRIASPQGTALASSPTAASRMTPASSRPRCSWRPGPLTWSRRRASWWRTPGSTPGRCPRPGQWERGESSGNHSKEFVHPNSWAILNFSQNYSNFMEFSQNVKKFLKNHRISYRN